jgi:hypothetical protein
LLSVLRDAGTIALAALPALTPQDQVFEEFSDYLRSERGLAVKSVIRHLPVVRRFLREVCPAGASDLGKISQQDVIRYVERHAWDLGHAGEQGFFVRHAQAGTKERLPAEQRNRSKQGGYRDVA